MSLVNIEKTFKVTFAKFVKKKRFTCSIQTQTLCKNLKVKLKSLTYRLYNICKIVGAIFVIQVHVNTVEVWKKTIVLIQWCILVTWNMYYIPVESHVHLYHMPLDPLASCNEVHHTYDSKGALAAMLLDMMSRPMGKQMKGWTCY